MIVVALGLILTVLAISMIPCLIGLFVLPIALSIVASGMAMIVGGAALPLAEPTAKGAGIAFAAIADSWRRATPQQRRNTVIGGLSGVALTGIVLLIVNAVRPPAWSVLVEWTPNRNALVYGKYATTPYEPQVYFGIAVRVTNKGRHALPTTPLAVKLLDPNTGKTYGAGTSSQEYEVANPYSDCTLNPGESVSGNIVVTVPRDEVVPQLELLYDPYGPSSPANDECDVEIKDLRTGQSIFIDNVEEYRSRVRYW